ncbi:ribose 5-phosphate isomerase B [Caldithrix abyssi]|uniref:Ribose-5-phosphate isomerase n=1 Tax=Caldithrix abyssi DSM 13497 TaxID=880073 RepID=H1XV92_CALAY|nr:ribose 5-phosphate isomerase B [Caldithrix abyssi]APF20949.1 ribose-5-phosphate isomerase [Caldithrix abyssi DSM 13497]EHO40598.1 sugar-phosphate isomerase, RpiB/LacA/LacB family [Caldithrix abyssi DSM 13497]
MKLAIGADHAGYVLKEQIKDYLKSKDIDFKDVGTFKIESCDYPEFAYKVGQAVSTGEADLGILICGTGIGMSITANKIKGVRAALAHDEQTAKLSRQHNNANVLCMGGRILSEEEAIQIVEVWLNTSFEGGRHEKRLKLITQLTGL